VSTNTTLIAEDLRCAWMGFPPRQKRLQNRNQSCQAGQHGRVYETHIRGLWKVRLRLACLRLSTMNCAL
jgi:hypothetical protein